MSALNKISFGARMFTTDLDSTLLNPAQDNIKKNVSERTYDLTSIKQTEDALKSCKFDTVLINTGRNYSELKEIESILKQTTMPIKAISLEDGKRLLNKPASLTPQQWMSQLFNKDINYLKFEDKNWTENNKKPLELIGEYLKEKKGFIHRKNNGEEIIYSKPFADDGTDIPRCEITLIPPGIKVKINVKGADNINKYELIKYASELNSEIKKMLEEHGYYTNTDTKEELSIISTFSRSDINKKAVADYVKSKFDEPTQEVRAGDSENDTEMLCDKSICAIQVGKNKKLTEKLRGFNVISVPQGHLADGIIKASASFYA